MVDELPLYCSADRLNLAAFYPLATHLGPGRRALVWLQGCLKQCLDCVTPEMQDIVERDWVGVPLLAKLVYSRDDCEGVTLIGGEPFLQYRAQAAFVKLVKESGRTEMIYTGYSYEELLDSQQDEVASILNLADILVDGPYLKDEEHGEMWRGSANQRILFLSDRYKEWGWAREARRWEFAVYRGQDGRYVFLRVPGGNS